MTGECVQDEFADAGGTRFAYRRLGRTQGVRLMLLMGFRGTMDDWDPALVKALAATRPMLLVDNPGAGRSAGHVPQSIGDWAQQCIELLHVLGLGQVDVLGFSMGGCVAQMMALNAPQVVRRLVLCGTTPSTGPEVTRAPIEPFNRLSAAVTDEERRDAFLAVFFTSSERSQAAGRASWHRIANAAMGRAPTPQTPPEKARRQAVAFAKFMDRRQASQASFDRLHELRLPVLVANGSHDVLLPTHNSIVLWSKLKHADAQLHLFPDSGHGFLFQYARSFARLVSHFLDDDDGRVDSRL
ncbi:hypothetical protein CDD81_3090 [Ophiocordyceps australis]|uniref:AB hydrolase-1 domain-containing protein n=1 Tax=Ophiocordyceps australis TaxID=1399860 RepID=A0A2C5YEC6_9HYPO|nr:hypothetical protein CDD81_3090 [Ophiocordyceps australis]